MFKSRIQDTPQPLNVLDNSTDTTTLYHLTVAMHYINAPSYNNKYCNLRVKKCGNSLYKCISNKIGGRTHKEHSCLVFEYE